MKHYLLLLLLTLTAAAHPVAQGSMELTLHPSHLTVHARISNEAVFLATAHAAATPPDAFAAHGDYLLRHLTLTADGTPLTGHVEKTTPPEDRSAKGFTRYELRYPFTALPREIRAEQNILNEITYAPGNPWESTFLIATQPPGLVADGTTLFTHKTPLILSKPNAAPATKSIFLEYLAHGFHHIIEGWDHLLFITALVLTARRWRELILIVTLFTVAHSITLVLSVCDIVRLSSHIVEPMIAASIIIIALQNTIRPSAAQGPLRLAMAFGFGLFHGLGFAGGLLDAMQELPGLPLGAALGGFSLGVELGHQLVVLPIFAILLLLRKWMSEARFTRHILRTGSALIAIAGIYYLIAALRGG